MIKIKRGKCPDVLTDSPQKGTHYNKKAVVDELHRMQHGKCCYCQGKIPDGGLGKHVEHFRPKGLPIYEHLMNDWGNLFLACPQCNGAKKDKFPVRFNGDIVRHPEKTGGEQLLIDPSDKNCDPEDHIDFVVDDKCEDALWGMAIAKNGSERGQLSIEVIELHGSHYTKERQTVLEELRYKYVALYDANKYNRTVQFDSAKNRIEVLMGSNCEYSACARAFARAYRLDKRYGVTIPKGYE